MMSRVLTLMCLFIVSFATNAALIPFVNKTTNDGVYSLSQAQAAFLGDSTATHIAFLRLRKGRGVNWQAGDVFNVNTILNSTGHEDKILGLLNGSHKHLNYQGEAFETFVSATLERRRNGYFRGVAFIFDEHNGAITFNGTSTFNARQSRGAANFIPVPLTNASTQRATHSAAQSANAIPEPSMLALYLAAGILLLVSKRVRARRIG